MEGVLGGGISLERERGKSDFRIQMVHLNDGVSKKKVENDNIHEEIKERGGGITQEILSVQNDDTAPITRSTSSSVSNGKTGIETISLHKRSVNVNVPSFPSNISAVKPSGKLNCSFAKSEIFPLSISMFMMNDSPAFTEEGVSKVTLISDCVKKLAALRTRNDDKIKRLFI